MTLHVAGPVEIDLTTGTADVALDSAPAGGQVRVALSQPVVRVLRVQRCLRCDELLTTVADGEDGLPVGEPVETAGGCEYAEP